MSYATVDELLAAVGKPVTAENTVRAQACLDAAAQEIDDAVDRVDPVPDGDALANRVNLLRGVEWWKANDAAWGVIGFDEIGALRLPKSTFARHAVTLTPLKQQWGVA